MKPNPSSNNTKATPSKSTAVATTRLNKYLSNAGLCSRREADEHIALGLVNVNGKIVTEMGYQVKATDKIKFDGQLIKQTPPVYILLNKPKGFVATAQGGNINKSVQELIRSGAKKKIPALGDMGRPTTGLLLFTNDDIIRKKWNNSTTIHMLYHVVLDKNLGAEEINRLKKGVTLQGKSYPVKAISHVSGGQKRELGVEVDSIPPALLIKIFASMEFKVAQLDRVLLAGLTKKDLARGNWRHLNQREIGFLKMMK